MREEENKSKNDRTTRASADQGGWEGKSTVGSG